MKPRKIASKKRYLWAFLIGTIIFILGFAITYSVAYYEYQRMARIGDDLSYRIFEEKLQFSLFEKDICKSEVYEKVSEELSFQGSVLAALEEKMGKENKDVLFRKKFYSLVLLEHLEMVDMINEECGKEIDTILFFYSNEKDDIKSAEEVGSILDVLYQQNKGDLYIYSFDINLDAEIITTLKEKYSVERPTTVIVNEDTILYSVDNIRELQTLLN